MSPETSQKITNLESRFIPPVLYLAFANHPNQLLPNLVEESREIARMLHPREQEGHYKIHREEFIELDSISQYLASYKDQVRIFHFAGHAGSQTLLFHDLEVNATGIGTMLAQQENLALVFLNGCSTKAQVEFLLNQGIPAVIATSAPIEDTRAKNFAIQFYQALANRHSIREAFDMAKGNMEARNNTPGLPIAFHRGIFLPDEALVDTQHWGLYVRDEKALEWTLPDLPLNLQTIMDPELLAKAAIETLTPYLVKGGEELAQGIGKDFWELIKKPFQSDRDKKKLEDLQGNPDDQKLQGKVEGKLEDMLADDPVFFTSLKELLAQMPKQDITNSMTINGNNNTANQGNTGSTITITNNN